MFTLERRREEHTNHSIYVFTFKSKMKLIVIALRCCSMCLKNVNPTTIEVTCFVDPAYQE